MQRNDKPDKFDLMDKRMDSLEDRFSARQEKFLGKGDIGGVKQDHLSPPLRAAIERVPAIASDVASVVSQVSGLASQVGDLDNKFDDYYDKTDVYNKTEVDTMFADLSVTGEATFTKSSNKIAMAELEDLPLEIGDVIQISGATNAANNKIFTVEDIDSNRQPFQQIDASLGIRARAICEWNGDVYVGSWSTADRPGLYVMRDGALPFVTLDTTTENNVWSMCVHKEQLYIATGAWGQLQSVDVSGNRANVIPLNAYSICSHGSLIYAGYNDGISTVDLETGTITLTDILTGKTIRDILVYEDYLYIADWTNTTGGVWKRRVSGGPWTQIATGQYANLAVVDDVMYATGVGTGIQYFNGSNFVDAGLGYSGQTFYGLTAVGDKLFLGKDHDSEYVRVSYPAACTVNYEHRNGAGPLSLKNEMLSKVSVRLLSKWYNAPLGLGQAWVDVTNKRGTSIVANSTGRAVSVTARHIGSSGAGDFIVDGVSISLDITNEHGETYTSIVPRGSYYRWIIAKRKVLELR